MSSMHLNGNLSRRSFIAAGASVAAASALTATAFADEAAEAPAWDKEADVVVLGAGGAGMRAAYEAQNAGCSVVVLEKAETFGGTSIVSGGIIQAAGTEAQKQLTGIEDDTPEAHAHLYMIEGEGWVDEDLVTDMCEHGPEHIAFLEGLGLEFTSITSVAHTPYSDAEGIQIPPRIHGTDVGAIGVYTTLHDATEALGVEFVYECEATALIQNENGAVVGVTAIDADGNEIRVKAARGVVIATSGIDHNLEMCRLLNQQQYWDLQTSHSACAQTNTGDGIRMGMAIGAMIRNFGGTVDLTARTWAGLNGETPNVPAIFVDCYGHRFVCEDCTYAYVSRALYQRIMQTGHDCYTVVGATSLPLMTAVGELTAETLDAEVAEGTAFKGETVAELAEAIGADADNLQATIDTWNADVANGVDTQFGRITGLAPIEAPYYAFTEGGVYNMGAIGGLAINVNAQVLDVAGEPIPHLYAAGMASAGWVGPYYPGSGTALLGGLHWGWRAGTNVAAEEPIA